MNRGEYLHLLGEKTVLGRMIAETPEDDVLDLASLAARLKTVEDAIAQGRPDERDPARVRLTFKGRRSSGWRRSTVSRRPSQPLLRRSRRHSPQWGRLPIEVHISF